MGSIKAISFDKTGTLTKGVPVVTDFHVLNENMEEKNLLALLAALESRSGHPLASAIMNKAKKHLSFIKILWLKILLL